MHTDGRMHTYRQQRQRGRLAVRWKKKGGRHERVGACVCAQASKDVLAMASLEVDLNKIEPGQTITVKWRGKPVFIKRRTPEDIELANQVPLKELRDPQTDAERVQKPEVWLGWAPAVGF